MRLKTFNIIEAQMLVTVLYDNNYVSRAKWTWIWGYCFVFTNVFPTDLRWGEVATSPQNNKDFQFMPCLACLVAIRA